MNSSCTFSGYGDCGHTDKICPGGIAGIDIGFDEDGMPDHTWTVCGRHYIKWGARLRSSTMQPETPQSGKNGTGV